MSSSGALPLHYAAAHDRREAVEALLAAHPAAARVEDACDRAPLHHAALGGASLGVLRLLCAAYPCAAAHCDTSLKSVVDYVVQSMAPRAAAWEEAEGRLTALEHEDHEWVSRGWPSSVPPADEDDRRLAVLLAAAVDTLLNRLQDEGATAAAGEAAGTAGAEVSVMEGAGTDVADETAGAPAKGVAAGGEEELQPLWYESVGFCVFCSLKLPQCTSALALLVMDVAVGGYGYHRCATLLAECSKRGEEQTPEGTHVVISSACQQQSEEDRILDKRVRVPAHAWWCDHGP
jgi:hypothetical protein